MKSVFPSLLAVLLLLLWLQGSAALAANVVTLSGRFQIASVTGAVTGSPELKIGDAHAALPGGDE
jgi:hypothetical protein